MGEVRNVCLKSQSKNLYDVGLRIPKERSNYYNDYTKDVVLNQLIYDLIDAGRRAPSAKNRQPWKVIYMNLSNKKITALEDMIDKWRILPDSNDSPRIQYKKIVLKSKWAIIVLKEIDEASDYFQIGDALSIGAFCENIIYQANSYGYFTHMITRAFKYNNLDEEIMSTLKMAGYLKSKPECELMCGIFINDEPYSFRDVDPSLKCSDEKLEEIWNEKVI